MESDSDSAFTTPPVTPARKNTKKTSDRCDQKLLTYWIKRAEAKKMNQKENDIGTATDQEGRENSITAELQQMMEDHVDVNQPQTLSIETVYEMFRRLENQYEDRLVKLEEHKDENPNVESTQQTRSMEEMCKKIEDLELRNRSLKSTLLRVCDNQEVIKQELRKTELNQIKKMAILSGLYTSQKKKEAIQDIEYFIREELGVNITVDDYYEIGEARPKTKVLIFQNLREKLLVMQNKKHLKDLRNEDDKPIYLNDFKTTETTEKKKSLEALYKENLSRGEPVKMQKEKGNLLINGDTYKSSIQPPKPQIMLEQSTEDLRRIMKIKIHKGPEVEKEGNRFIGFSLAVKDLKEVEQAYIKMRLCYPGARHIICAYSIKGKESEFHLLNESCDDDEHGAGQILLEILLGNEMECRAIFVARYYSGTKLGLAQFECIESAAEKCLELSAFNEVLQIEQIVSLQHDSSQEEYEMRDANEIRNEEKSWKKVLSRKQGYRKYNDKKADLPQTQNQKRQRSFSPESSDKHQKRRQYQGRIKTEMSDVKSDVLETSHSHKVYIIPERCASNLSLSVNEKFPLFQLFLSNPV